MVVKDANSSIKDINSTLVNKLSLTAEGMENHFDGLFRLKAVKNGVRFYELSDEGRMSLADVVVYPDDGVMYGWMFNHEHTSNTPFFWSKLWEDPVFKYKVRQKWEKLRKEAFKTNKLIAYIDSIAVLLSEAQQREFEKWPVLGEYVWRETTGFENRDTYEKEVAYLKYFLIQRWSWMDAQLAQIPNPNPAAINVKHILEDILLYPNPAKNFLTFEINSTKTAVAYINIYNHLGILVHSTALFDLSQGNNSHTLNLDKLNRPGVYLYKVIINNELGCTGRFIKTN